MADRRHRRPDPEADVLAELMEFDGHVVWRWNQRGMRHLDPKLVGWTLYVEAGTDEVLYLRRGRMSLVRVRDGLRIRFRDGRLTTLWHKVAADPEALEAARRLWYSVRLGPPPDIERIQRLIQVVRDWQGVDPPTQAQVAAELGYSDARSVRQIARHAAGGWPAILAYHFRPGKPAPP